MSQLTTDLSSNPYLSDFNNQDEILLTNELVDNNRNFDMSIKSQQKEDFLKSTYYRRNLQYGLGSLGFAGGLWYAYKKEKGFWGYLGFSILFSIGGSALGYFTGSIIDKPNSQI